MKAKAIAFALLAIVAAWGCTSSTSEEPDTENGEDELSLFGRGNVDHAAIVESTTMMLAGGPTDGNLDPYNREDPFAIRGTQFNGAFSRRLGNFDRYDGRTDWKPEQAAAWAARMSAGNYQVIDTQKPCDWQNPHTYLEIERAKLTGRQHTTCGGRMPNEDALDVTLNFLVRGPAASAQDRDALHDRVDSATKPATDQFPYMAEMN
jgi:hypothetical protein